MSFLQNATCHDCNKSTPHVFVEIGSSALYHGKCIECGRYLSIMCTKCYGVRDVLPDGPVRNRPDLCTYKCKTCGGYAGIGVRKNEEGGEK